MFLRAPANARVAPGWVFFGNPHDELPDLLDHAGTSEPLAGIDPLPGDEVSVRETWFSNSFSSASPLPLRLDSLTVDMSDETGFRNRSHDGRAVFGGSH